MLLLTNVVFRLALAFHQVHEIGLVAQIALLLLLLGAHVNMRVVITAITSREKLLSSLGPSIETE